MGRLKQTSKITLLVQESSNCCMYIDPSADLEKACRLISDSMHDSAAASGGLGTILIHEHLVMKGVVPKLLVGILLLSMLCWELCPAAL